MSVETRFLQSMRRLEIPPRSRCLAAFSGGGDSVALLHLACLVSERYPIEVWAARVNHALRPEEIEQKETLLCQTMCKRAGVPFTGIEIPPGLIKKNASKSGSGIEHAAREARYKALEAHRKAVGADCILLGHTADDQLETVLMRLLSGSGLEGLKGIPAQRGCLYRPLLSESRESLRIYLESEGIKWADDPTNEESIFRRNRIRNELIPLLHSIVPGWENALRNLSERSEEAVDLFLRTGREQLPITHDNPSAYSWEKSSWNAAHPYLRAQAIWDGFDRLSFPPGKRLSWRTLREARAAVEKGQSWSGAGLRLKQEKDKIILKREEPQEQGCIVITQENAQRGMNVLAGDVLIAVHTSDRENSVPFSVRPDEWPIEVRFQKKTERNKSNSSRIDFSLRGPNGKIQRVGNKRVSPDEGNKFVYIVVSCSGEENYVRERK